MPDPTPMPVFPETEIVDAWSLMEELDLSSLEVSDGKRLVGVVTRAAIEQHRADAERTRLVGSIMALPPTMMSARANRASSASRGDRRPAGLAETRIRVSRRCHHADLSG